MDIRKLSYVLAFVLAASFGAFACGDEEDPAENNGKVECKADETLCGENCVNTKVNNNHCGACNNTCGAEEVCTDGECVGEGGGGDKKEGEACATSDECEGDLECEENEAGDMVCTQPEGGEGKGVTEACETSDECEGDLVCDETKETCVRLPESACESDDECMSNYVCEGEEGAKTCQEDESGGGNVGAVCDHDDKCNGDLVCIDGKCAEPLKGEGEECEADEECEEGLVCVEDAEENKTCQHEIPPDPV